jgi:intracellular multiplication protein IcmJ
MDDDESDLADREYIKVRRNVLARDKHKCQFCGFEVSPNRTAPPETSEASGYLEVHHLDDDHSNNDLDNLVSTCPFCHQVFHAGFSAKRGAATLAWIPEMSQASVNLMSNLCFCLLHRADLDKSNAAYSSDARKMLADFRGREKVLDDLFGEGFITMKTLPAILSALHRAKLYDKRDKLFSGLRLVPRPEVFATHITWWCRTSNWGEPSRMMDTAFDGEQILGKH